MLSWRYFRQGNLKSLGGVSIPPAKGHPSYNRLFTKEFLASPFILFQSLSNSVKNFCCWDLSREVVVVRLFCGHIFASTWRNRTAWRFTRFSWYVVAATWRNTRWSTIFGFDYPFSCWFWPPWSILDSQIVLFVCFSSHFLCWCICYQPLVVVESVWCFFVQVGRGTRILLRPLVCKIPEKSI